MLDTITLPDYLRKHIAEMEKRFTVAQQALQDAFNLAGDYAAEKTGIPRDEIAGTYQFDGKTFTKKEQS